jgi:hypothetical protein
MQQSPPDLGALAHALDAEGLRYVLIGGLAAVMLGGTNATYDADLAIAYDHDNVSRLVQALAPLHPRPLRLAPGAAWVWDEFCVRPPWSLFVTNAGRVDLILRLPGIDSFDGLYARSRLLPYEDTHVRVASIDDLIAMKAMSDRVKDQLHLVELQALKRLDEDEGLGQNQPVPDG